MGEVCSFNSFQAISCFLYWKDENVLMESVLYSNSEFFYTVLIYSVIVGILLKELRNGDHDRFAMSD